MKYLSVCQFLSIPQAKFQRRKGLCIVCVYDYNEHFDKHKSMSQVRVHAQGMASKYYVCKKVDCYVWFIVKNSQHFTKYFSTVLLDNKPIKGCNSWQWWLKSVHQFIIVCYEGIVEMLNYHISLFHISSTFVMMAFDLENKGS